VKSFLGIISALTLYIEYPSESIVIFSTTISLLFEESKSPADTTDIPNTTVTSSIIVNNIFLFCIRLSSLLFYTINYSAYEIYIIIQYFLIFKMYYRLNKNRSY